MVVFCRLNQTGPSLAHGGFYEQCLDSSVDIASDDGFMAVANTLRKMHRFIAFVAGDC